jgi:dCMP deaminase
MIIGLTGSLAAGKGVVSEFLKSKGFVYLSLSDELREIAKERKIEITRKNLQDLGNLLREEEGSGFLAERIYEKIINQCYKKAVIDGIRNPAELDVLRKIRHFYLISVDAPQEIRFKRLILRNRESDPITWQDFLIIDQKDKGEGEPKTGQRVSDCMKFADYHLINDSDVESMKNKTLDLYQKMECCIPRPSWDEYFMEISRAVASRATCNRGRSGCVIAKNKQILVTGYVGSPKGLPHCDEIGHLMKKTIHEDGTITNHCVRTTHAEQNAICQAAKLGISIDGSTLYCKMTPCPVCAKMIINSGIKRVVSEKAYHASKETEDMFKLAGVELDILDKNIENYDNQ